MGYLLIKITLLLLLLIAPQTSWSDESINDFMSSYRLTVGVSAYGGEFDVFDNNESPAVGTLTENISYAPYVLLGGPYEFFW